VRENALPSEIKTAFRVAAKKLHPDMHQHDIHKQNETEQNESVEKMRILLTAYETLLDGKKRAEYDRALFRRRERFSVKRYTFDYRKFLQDEPDDKKLQARLIFLELLQDRGGAALDVWRAQGGTAFPMKKFMDREDFMDISFLLAEELVKMNCLAEAKFLLEEILEEETHKPYFRHFALDVEEFYRSVKRRDR
jgi:curved DNA-binding protein CbpA